MFMADTAEKPGKRVRQKSVLPSNERRAQEQVDSLCVHTVTNSITAFTPCSWTMALVSLLHKP